MKRRIIAIPTDQFLEALDMKIRIVPDQNARVIVIRNDGTREDQPSVAPGAELSVEVEPGEQVRIVEAYEQPESPEVTEDTIQLKP